ncbi:hypothetical protein A2U01_0055938, partial [Trifolium medium]|nr:hypothetical protein [Trifolium medium]
NNLDQAAGNLALPFGTLKAVFLDFLENLEEIHLGFLLFLCPLKWRQ